MRVIITYLMALLVAFAFLFYRGEFKEITTLMLQCAYVGAMGGIFFSLRSLYIHKCVRNDWDGNRWGVWYYLRPVASLITGFIAYVFLKAGLLMLNNAQDTSGSGEPEIYGYWAVAFIAGYNVDGFMKRLENIAAEIFGIESPKNGEGANGNNDTQGTPTKKAGADI